MILSTTPQQRLALAQSDLHWLFHMRRISGHRAAVRAAIHTTVLAGKAARNELKAQA